MSASSAPRRDLSLDLLRGGAVLFIVGYYHIQEIWQSPLPGPLAGWLARVALALFCFLSGYLLSGRKAISSWADVGHFYRGRFLKIYPLYFLALVAFVGLGLCPSALFWPSAFLINTLIDWSLLTLWFISMIFLFYLVTPLYLWRPSIQKTLGLTIIFMAILGVARVTNHGIDPRLFPNLLAFALGIFLTQSPNLKAIFFQPSPNVRSMTFFSMLFLGFLLWQTTPQDALPTHMILILIWFVATLPGLLLGARWLATILPARAIDFLATASFILYLSHRIIFYLGEQIWRAPTVEMRQIYYLVVLLPTALIFSYFGQRLWQKCVK